MADQKPRGRPDARRDRSTVADVDALIEVALGAERRGGEGTRRRDLLLRLESIPGIAPALEALARLPPPDPAKGRRPKAPGPTPPAGHTRPPRRRAYPRRRVRARIREALGVFHCWCICNRCLSDQLALPRSVIARQTHWLAENDEYTREWAACDFCHQPRLVIQVDPW